MYALNVFTILFYYILMKLTSAISLIYKISKEY
jgi:hypothetical protein